MSSGRRGINSVYSEWLLLAFPVADRRRVEVAAEWLLDRVQQSGGIPGREEAKVIGKQLDELAHGPTDRSRSPV